MKYGNYVITNNNAFPVLPSHWEIKSGRYCFAENKEKNSDFSQRTLLQFTYGTIARKKNQEIISADEEIYKKYTQVIPNDIMLNGLNLNYDFVSQRVGLVKEKGIITSAYLSLRCHDVFNPSYANYLLKSLDAQKIFHGMGSGVRLTLGYPEFSKIQFPVPPRAEQDQIVRYLDWQLSKINKLIHGYQRQNLLINDIKNRKIQDIILTADTRKYMRLKYLGSFEKGGGFSRDNLCVNGFPAILYGDIYTQYVYKTDIVNHRIDEGAYSKAVKIGHGDIVFAGTGETKEEIGKPIIYLGQDIVAIGGDVISFKNKSSLSSKYLLYFLYSEEALRYRYINGKGDIIVHISSGSLGNHIIPIPSKENEERIVSQIEKVINDTTKIVNDILNEIQLLKEYRTRLISDVVTGQMDVREIEIPEYTPEEDTDESFESDADDIENAGEEVDSDE